MCQRVRPIAEFTVCRASKDGLDRPCKSCKRLLNLKRAWGWVFEEPEDRRDILLSVLLGCPRNVTGYFFLDGLSGVTLVVAQELNSLIKANRPDKGPATIVSPEGLARREAGRRTYYKSVSEKRDRRVAAILWRVKNGVSLATVADSIDDDHPLWVRNDGRTWTQKSLSSLVQAVGASGRLEEAKQQFRVTLFNQINSLRAMGLSRSEVADWLNDHDAPIMSGKCKTWTDSMISYWAPGYARS